MKRISYSKEKIEFITDLRKSVNAWFAENNIQPYGNSKILVKTAVISLLYIIPYVLMVSGIVTSVYGILASWMVMGIGTAGMGMATMHDANHGSFSRHQWVNRLFGNSLYLLGGYPPNWRHQHNTLHHGFPNVEGHDEDIDPLEIIRISPHKPLKKVHRYQHVYAWFLYSLMTISWVTTKDFNRLKKYRNEGVVLGGSRNYRLMFMQLVASKIFYYGVFLLIPILVVPVAWYWLVLGFVVMHLTGGLILTTIFQTAHVVPTSEYPVPDENGELNNNWALHQLYTTCNFAPRSRIFSWFIGGLNYQVEHHLFPNISHVHYRSISAIVEQKAREYNLPYNVNSTFAKAVYEHVRMLRLLGTSENYAVQVVPSGRNTQTTAAV